MSIGVPLVTGSPSAGSRLSRVKFSCYLNISVFCALSEQVSDHADVGTKGVRLVTELPLTETVYCQVRLLRKGICIARKFEQKI